ncbi:multidrug effflux MFS transporter [Legionella hackeliae]|uniref:Bcr/CflA family efflux transporter n=1 Tax=Legionella hackeliae TaxID=449 RepID=A0A0A8UPK0_LEGHA|nr:multidrug effflux MFS transporter [Legionella hackeliae]KTD09864.1 multidrug resistance protein D [Legionella hackeliae]CEK10805.1 Permeases of the major facilitator superfamily [Legionella hackeliae]STX47542.1 multidrug resistance protein D [Legionella hackeliae]
MQSKSFSEENKKTPFIVLGILSTFSLLTFDLYQPALPAITSYFNTTHELGQLTLSLFFFIFGFSQLIWGPLIDHFGRRKTLRASLILFFLGTLGCIFATSIEMLIVSRAVQGFTICCAYIVAFSASRDEEDSTDRARVLSHISMIVSVSPIFAPLLGSIIFIHYGWQATFVLMALIAIILFILAEKTLQESRHWTKSDIGFLWQTSLSSFKKILTHGPLWISIALVTASYSCVMIIVVNAAYLVIDNLNFSPLIFAILFGSNGIMLIIGNYIGIKLREKKSMVWNIRLGSIIMVLSSVAMIVLFYMQGLTLLVLAPILLMSLGVSFINPPAFSLALNDYPSEAGTVTAFLNTVRMTCSAIVGGITGILIFANTSVLVFGLFLCALVCVLFSFYLKD